LEAKSVFQIVIVLAGLLALTSTVSGALLLYVGSKAKAKRHENIKSLVTTVRPEDLYPPAPTFNRSSRETLVDPNIPVTSVRSAVVSLEHLEHMDILGRGVEVWNRWRQEEPAEHPVLSGVNLSRTDLRGINLSGANLIGADLNVANLSEANLVGARLYHADLRDAYLIRSDFSGADLTGANFMGADLSIASFTGANLTNANLRDARLFWTNFGWAKLTEMDLTGANLLGTAFGNVDLRATRGLDSVYHFGPSTVGIDAISMSEGAIPEAFLRGVGMSDDIITCLHSLTGQHIEFYSCFISYSHQDKVFARRLHDALQARGIRCWLDEHQILPGDDMFDQVDRGIRLYDKMLLCCSEHSLSSWWVENEIEFAFRKEQRLMKEQGRKVQALIPLNLDGYLFKWKNGKAQQVKKRLAADFTSWEKDNSIFEKQVERIVKALMVDDRGRAIMPRTL
jgi:hypothetical protein